MEELQESILRCMRCGFCRAVCPLFEETKLESSVARGKLAIIKGLLEEDIELDESVAEKIFQCMLCRSCVEECPAGVEVDEIIQKARSRIFGKVELPIYEHIAENIEEYGNPFAEDAEDAERLDAKIVYFPGCNSQYRAKEISASIASIFKKLNLDYGVANNMCCGLPLAMMGKEEEARQVIENDIDKLKDSGIETLVVSCASCYYALGGVYKKELEDAGINVVHLTEFINDLVEKGKMKFLKLDKTLTYHDPCHLGRHSGIFQEPRRIIVSIPGVEFVEMARHSRESRCCGAGGDMSLGYIPLSVRIARRRMEDVKEVDADILVTACPTCYRTLSGAAEGIEVVDISMLVDRQLEE